MTKYHDFVKDSALMDERHSVLPMTKWTAYWLRNFALWFCLAFGAIAVIGLAADTLETLLL